MTKKCSFMSDSACEARIEFSFSFHLGRYDDPFICVSPISTEVVETIQYKTWLYLSTGTLPETVGKRDAVSFG